METLFFEFLVEFSFLFFKCLLKKTEDFWELREDIAEFFVPPQTGC